MMMMMIIMMIITMKVAEWVELLPAGVASELFDRVMGYDGDDDR